MNRAPINAFAINGNYTIPLTLGASVARLRVESALNSKVAKTHVHASGIPSKYHPAHPSWQLPVGAEDWTFIVAPEGDRDAYRCSA